MSPIAQIHSWVIHLARRDDEFAAKCGRSDPGTLVAEKAPDRWLLPGYKMCEECEEKL